MLLAGGGVRWLTGPRLPSSPAVLCCLAGFLLGLLFVQRSGSYFVAMFDDYSATLPLLIVVAFEAFAMAWIYGAERCVSAGPQHPPVWPPLLFSGDSAQRAPPEPVGLSCVHVWGLGGRLL